MSLLVNSPAYYTEVYGINQEIYKMCRVVEKNIDIKNYTSQLDTVGITPIIAPKEVLCDGKYKEVKMISLSYRIASISLHIDYSDYISSNLKEKKALVINNVFDSLLLVKKRLKNNFDYERFKKDILVLLKDQLVR